MKKLYAVLCCAARESRVVNLTSNALVLVIAWAALRLQSNCLLFGTVSVALFIFIDISFGISIMLYRLSSYFDLTGNIEESLDDERDYLPENGTTIFPPPISRLPDELLILIFTQCITAQHEILCHYPIYLSFSQVCRDWRTLALNTPMLWTRPDFRWPLWAKEMLQRSQDAPLDIKYRVPSGSPCPDPESQGAIVEALSNISRVANLSLRLIPAFDEWQPLDSLEKPAPILHTLSIRFYAHSALEEDPFPEQVLGGHAPSLRKLTIEGCHFGRTYPLMKNLTFLSLRTHDRPLQSPCSLCPTTAQMREILSSMPDLQVLRLHNTVPFHDPAATSYDSSPIKLSRLRSVELASPVSNCTNLLSMITFPASAEIRLFCLTKGTEDDYISLFSSLSRLYSNASVRSYALILQGGTIAGGDNISLTINAWSKDTVRPDLNLHLSLHDHPSDSFIHASASVLPLGDLESLTLDSIDVQPSTLVECFGALKYLSSIHLTHPDIGINMTEALGRGLVEDMTDLVPFLPLETIQMRGVDFRVLIIGDLLANVVKMRAAHGAKLRSLVLRECLELPKWEVNRIREIVPKDVDVDWDGHYIRLASGESDEEGYEDSDEYYEQQVSDYE